MSQIGQYKLSTSTPPTSATHWLWQFVPTMSCAFYQLLCAGNQTSAVKTLAYVAWIISQSLWPVFTGFVHPSESCSSLRLLSTVPCIAQLLDTCRINCIESPTCRRRAGWGQRLPTDLTFVHHGWSLLETAHLLLLALGSGIVSLKTSHLLHHCQCFDINWRLTCFGTRTQTLLVRRSGHPL